MVAITTLVFLAGLPLMTLAIKSGRHEMDLAARTVLPRHDEVGDWSIAPTPPPNQRFAAMALKRQAGGPTCGYYEFNSEAYDCFTNQQCVTSGSYFACTGGSSPYTSCLDGFNSICSQSAQGLGTLCCNFNTDFPLCVTALKPLTTGAIPTITGFRCGNNKAKGKKLLLETTGRTSSSTSALSSSSNSTSTTFPPSTTVSPFPATSTAVDTDSDSSGAPIGAIVGGVVGGLLVVGVSAFAIVWLVIRSRRKDASPPPPAPGGAPSMMNQPYTYSAMPSHGGVPMEPMSPAPAPAYDSFKGHYQTTSAVALPGDGYHPSQGAFGLGAGDGMYQQAAPAPSLSPAPPSSHGPSPALMIAHSPPPGGFDMRRVSEVPAINPAGMGNNASELPS
ncbi:hypothetical protein CSOJ01_13643 [Colletotrichum sojae]|uniref:Uncharacterized protein n=1 Tax=Colletotrichum sojae TaxID=2175907 RepID=A0A8H6IRU7_9PEZI|nr:hypothetical protein CSOJ01_13643 [Colletotrichum sojae]